MSTDSDSDSDSDRDSESAVVEWLEADDSVAAGFTVGVKEIIDVRGCARTAGSRVPVAGRTTVAEDDAPIVEALRRAGGAPLARTRSHEYAWGISGMGGDGSGPTNPLSPDRVPGGSSSGSAVLVSTGSVDIGVGTDTAGSARIPAAYCGVVGFKPTYARFPTRGVVPLAPSFDTVGLLARRLEALIELWRVLTGEDASETAPARELLVDERLTRTDGAIEPAIRTRAVEVITQVDREGGIPAIVTPLGWERARDVFGPLQAHEALRVHREVLGTWPGWRDLYGADVASRLAAAELVSASDVSSAMDERAAMREQVDALLGEDRVVYSLVSPAFAPLRHEPDTVRICGSPVTARDAVLPFTIPASLLGLPAVALPVGRAPNGLPVSVQLVGAAGADAIVLATAAAVAARLSDEPVNRP